MRSELALSPFSASSLSAIPPRPPAIIYIPLDHGYEDKNEEFEHVDVENVILPRYVQVLLLMIMIMMMMIILIKVMMTRM